MFKLSTVTITYTVFSYPSRTFALCETIGFPYNARLFYTVTEK